ncbi:two-component system response regulator [Desulfoluna limicola]|uniref:Two-component system response regulator n=1 Tax=Desulfoluna limicola TaxID=2810562 RepID=A0ABM7PJ04_9BACT|nr:HD domain-containing phosphohydrolase [Desulfoluna limicola]BCS97135.1 two-component system response regulator [Desulfoluna limicola]
MENMDTAKILYVDDDQDLIQIYTRFLEGERYVLKTAENAEEGLEIALAFKPDLIISDVAMPGMDGLEFCRRVRAFEELKEVIFMLVSGIDVEPADVVSGLGAGADEYLVKPFSRDELVARIGTLLRIKGLKDRADCADNFLQDELQSRDAMEATLAELKEELAGEREALSGALKQVASLVDERQKAVERADAMGALASRTLDTCVGMLVHALDARSGFKRGHGADVAHLAVSIAEEMGVEGENLQALERASRLHELGLLFVSDALAGKNPLDYTESEVDFLSQHPARAAAMLAKVEGLEETARIVRHLFEHLDGSGTPRGVKKEAIPLASRIIAVADAYENLLAWPAGGSEGDRLDRLEEEAGTRFDPKVVHCLRKCLGRKPETEAGDQVEISVFDVKPGMVLASAIFTAKGAMLLPENTILTEEYIRQIARYNRIDSLEETVFIKG